MWAPLDQDDLLDQARQSLAPEGVEPLLQLLFAARDRPWASKIGVVTSMGRLSLTSNRRYGEPTATGVITLIGKGEEVTFSYCPPHALEEEPSNHPLGDALGYLEVLVARLLDDVGALSPEERSEDRSRSEPRFPLGSRVRVVPNNRNRTLHLGVVAESVWHHKYGCWTYYLEADGKRVSKRYVAEDFRPRP